jgi:hypothetical protein
MSEWNVIDWDDTTTMPDDDRRVELVRRVDTRMWVTLIGEVRSYVDDGQRKVSLRETDHPTYSKEAIPGLVGGLGSGWWRYL